MTKSQPDLNGALFLKKRMGNALDFFRKKREWKAEIAAQIKKINKI